MYRLYFLSGHSGIAARQDFEAHSDAEALEMAAARCEAASDACTGVEVWHDRRLIGTHANVSSRIETMSRDNQERVLQLEMAIRGSQSAISNSQKLLARLDLLHRLLGRDPLA